MNRLGPYGLNTIVAGNCLEIMAGMPGGCVDLVFTDYPFAFSSNDWDTSLAMTQDLAHRTMPMIWRILKPSGTAYLMFGHDSVAYAKMQADRVGFQLINWIIWAFGVGYHPTSKYKTRAYHILYLAKGDTWIFNGDHIRISHKTKDKRNNPLGAIPSDVWADIPDVKKNSREYQGHKGQKPEALLERIIKASSNEGDLIFDPFIGSGTTAVAADRLGRKFFGCDINPKYVKMALRRIVQDRESRAQMELF